MSASVPDPTEAALARLALLQAQGADRRDAVGWHYIETLARRTRSQSGRTQQLLSHKLQQALDHYSCSTPTAPGPAAPPPVAGPSPLGALLKEMTQPVPTGRMGQGPGGQAENPRIRQFRQELRKISVHKQVTQAIAQAPHNAGPINSHLLVLRALGLMRELSPDYLNRFMTHVDSLLCLEEAGPPQQAPGKAPGVKKGKKRSA